MASEIAAILQGKKHAAYNPRLAGEDRVIVKNIAKIAISAKKRVQKKYYRHTTQIGHLKERTMQMMWDKHGPGWVLHHAVMGMLPKNKLQARRIKRLIIE